jgi:hypothetical protein
MDHKVWPTENTKAGQVEDRTIPGKIVNKRESYFN